MDFPHYGDPLAEIGHIWGFWALSGELVEVNVEGRTEAYECCLVSSKQLCNKRNIKSQKDNDTDIST